MFDTFLKSKTSVRLYNQANQLAKKAQKIADGFSQGHTNKHQIAVLARGYAELYTQVKEAEDVT